MKVEIDFNEWFERPSETRDRINNHNFKEMEVNTHGLLRLISYNFEWNVCFLKQKDISVTNFDPFFIERILKEIEDHESRN